MGFGDLKSKAGQQALNTYLADRSYIEGCDFLCILASYFYLKYKLSNDCIQNECQYLSQESEMLSI